MPTKFGRQQQQPPSRVNIGPSQPSLAWFGLAWTWAELSNWMLSNNLA